MKKYKELYWDKTRLLSYNAILNFIVGHRGGGKSYDMKKWCIRDFLQNKKQFVWLRRYGSELTEFTSFMNDIAHEFKDTKVTIKKHREWFKVYINDELGGYAFTLTQAGKVKSTSFHGVDKIVFDEFLLMPGQRPGYLRDEVVILFDIMETVFRDRKVRGCYCIANNISFDNPYFREFDIKDTGEEFQFFPERGVLVQKYENEVYVEHKKATRFGKLIAGTKYAAYSIENESLVDNDTFIERMSNQTDFMYSLVMYGNTYGFWFDKRDTKWYVSKKFNKSARPVVFTKSDHNEGHILVKNEKHNPIINLINNTYQGTKLRFEELNIKNDVLSLLDKYFD